MTKAFETEEERLINQEMEELISAYNKMYKSIRSELDKICKIREQFPIKFLTSEDYEDHVITASGCKHKAIQLKRAGIAQYTAVDSDYKHYSAKLKIDIADGYLSMRFDKVTDKLRESYVDANTNVYRLRKLRGRFNSIMEEATDLVRQFQADEYNFRIFMEQVNKLKGI